MLKAFIDATKCELCGGSILPDQEATLVDYSVNMDINMINLYDSVDNIINKYIVYKCVSCGSVFKYNYKDLEKKFRRMITEKFLMLVVKGLMRDINTIRSSYFFYCGKCQGYDGKGGCPPNIFNNCEIKRFPLNEL